MIHEVNKNINTQQNKKIAALEAKFAMLKRVSSMPKKAKRKVKKAARVQRSSHPLSTQVKGLLTPAAALPGTVHHLVDAAPSQKYSLKSRGTLSVAASATAVGIVSPAFIQNSDYSSAVFATAAYNTLASATISNTQTGSGFYPTGVTGLVLRPTRPYSDTSQLTWRLVSYQLRVRYAGTALNANGNFKCLNNVHGEARFADTVSSRTWAQIADLVDSNVHTSLRTVYDRAVQDYPGIGSTIWLDEDRYYGADINATGHGSSSLELVGTTIGQASSNLRVGEPGFIFTYLNSSTSAVNLEFELYENWEVRGPSVAPFMTPSHPDPILHEEIMRTVISSHIHSSKDSGVGGSMTKYLKLANNESKSPLGRAVIAAALA